MKLKSKILLSLGGVFLLFGVAVAVALVGMQSTKNRFERFLEHDLALAQAATNLYAHGLQMGQALRNIVMDPANQAAYTNLENSAKEFKSIGDAALVLAADVPDDRKLLEDVMALRAQQIPLQANIVSMASADQAGAIASIAKDETPVWRNMRLKLMDYIKVKNDAVETTKAEMAAYSERMLTITLALVVVALIVSGGHTMIAAMPDHSQYEILGQTIDDAAGEAFDKIARFVGLGFPGGPEIDRRARDGDPAAIAFPRALQHDGTFNFSFSGLKTAVIRWIRDREAAGDSIDIADLAASFQEAIVDVQVAKTIRAATERGFERIVIAGGVAANSRLRALMTEKGKAAGLDVVVPSVSLCTDNGAMIAAAGMRRLMRGESSDLGLSANPNLALA